MGITSKEVGGDLEGSDTGVGYTEENVVHKSDFTAGTSLYARMQRVAGKFGVEQRGIERVPSDERTDTDMSKTGTMVGGRTYLSSHHGNLFCLTSPAVVFGQHGCLDLCHWRPGHPYF